MHFEDPLCTPWFPASLAAAVMISFARMRSKNRRQSRNCFCGRYQLRRTCSTGLLYIIFAEKTDPILAAILNLGVVCVCKLLVLCARASWQGSPQRSSRTLLDGRRLCEVLPVPIPFAAAVAHCIDCSTAQRSKTTCCSQCPLQEQSIMTMTFIMRLPRRQVITTLLKASHILATCSRFVPVLPVGCSARRSN